VGEDGNLGVLRELPATDTDLEVIGIVIVAEPVAGKRPSRYVLTVFSKFSL
jgi:hypothetical protein